MKRLLTIFTVVGSALLLYGCTQTLYMGRAPQVHFTYPNANVTPMNRVKGEFQVVKFLGTPVVTSDVMKGAYDDALRKASGADVLINVDLWQKITPLFLVTIMKFQVEGTAAKQSVGEQEIGGGK